MGFFAESLREHISNHDKENQLIKMFVADLKSDTAKLNIAVEYQKTKLHAIDTLRRLAYRASGEHLADSLYEKMYYLYKTYTHTAPAFRPTMRVLSQLEKSDAYSLIKSRDVSDSIILYKENDDHVESVFKIFREYYQLKALEIGETIFDGSMLEDFSTTDKVGFVIRSTKKFNLVTNEKNVLLLYGIKLLYCSKALDIYIRILEEQKESAVRLIELIQKEYSLKNE